LSIWEEAVFLNMLPSLSMLCPSLDTFDNGYQRRDNYVKLLIKHVDHSTIAHYLRRMVVDREYNNCTTTDSQIFKVKFQGL